MRILYLNINFYYYQIDYFTVKLHLQEQEQEEQGPEKEHGVSCQWASTVEERHIVVGD